MGTTDAGRTVALMALEAPAYRPADMLEEVLRFAFAELGFHRTDQQLLALVDELRADIEGDA